MSIEVNEEVTIMIYCIFFEHHNYLDHNYLQQFFGIDLSIQVIYHIMLLLHLLTLNKYN